MIIQETFTTVLRPTLWADDCSTYAWCHSSDQSPFGALYQLFNTDYASRGADMHLTYTTTNELFHANYGPFVLCGTHSQPRYRLGQSPKHESHGLGHIVMTHVSTVRHFVRHHSIGVFPF